MPLKKNQRSLLEKLLSGGVEGAGMGLMMSQLMGTEEAGMSPDALSQMQKMLSQGAMDDMGGLGEFDDTTLIGGAPDSAPSGVTPGVLPDDQGGFAMKDPMSPTPSPGGGFSMGGGGGPGFDLQSLMSSGSMPPHLIEKLKKMGVI